jgi:hypothetical protein
LRKREIKSQRSAAFLENFGAQESRNTGRVAVFAEAIAWPSKIGKNRVISLILFGCPVQSATGGYFTGVLS